MIGYRGVVPGKSLGAGPVVPVVFEAFQCVIVTAWNETLKWDAKKTIGKSTKWNMPEKFERK